jgi:hypothetical protein
MPMFQKEEIASELQNAVETIYRNDENQIALGLNYTLNDKSLHEIEAYDISLLNYYQTDTS